MVIKMTVGPVDRKGKNALSCCQRADFVWGYKYPTFELVLNKFLKSKILILSSVKIQVFKRVLEPKDFIFICFKGLEKSRKKKVFGKLF